MTAALSPLRSADPEPTPELIRWQRLDAVLADHAWLWRPRPFKERRPSWATRLPALMAQLLDLSDADLAALSADDSGLRELLAEHVPELRVLAELSELPARAQTALTELAPSFGWDIPGRKWAQVQAFVAAVGAPRGPWLDWCGGKGHLGRLLAAQSQQPVTTLERDEALCRDGQRLAQKRRVNQRFVTLDALSSAALDEVAGTHPVALHACGELHRTLLRSAAAAQVPALDIAPCCYYHGAAPDYQPMHAQGVLRLSRDDLHVAVTETVTSVAREVRQRDQEMAWKLGFQALREAVTGSDRYVPIRLGVRADLRSDFTEFCRVLAERERLALPAGLDWPRFEALGWRRQREVMRLALVRAAFRRPLELWLVLDLALFLQAHGYAVTLGEFCPRQLTPRNILLSAYAR